MSTSNKISGNYTFKDLILKTYISKKRAQAAAQGMTINFTSILDDVIDAGMEAIRKGQAVKKFRFDELREIMSALGVVVLDIAPEVTSQGGLFDETGELRKKLSEAELKIIELQDQLTAIMSDIRLNSPAKVEASEEDTPIRVSSKKQFATVMEDFIEDFAMNEQTQIRVKTFGLKNDFIEKNILPYEDFTCEKVYDGVHGEIYIIREIR